MIIAVINTTKAVVKLEPEKNSGLNEIRSSDNKKLIAMSCLPKAFEDVLLLFLAVRLIAVPIR